MSTQNQNPSQGQQNQTPSEETTRRQQGQQSQEGMQELNQDEQKEVEGGSGLLSGGNSLTGILGGNIGISNSSSGSNGDHSYTSEDSHNIDLGLGGILDNTNY